MPNVTGRGGRRAGPGRLPPGSAGAVADTVPAAEVPEAEGGAATEPKRRRVSQKATADPPARKPSGLPASSSGGGPIVANSVDRKSFNAEYLTNLGEAVETVMNHPVMANIRMAEPLAIQRNIEDL